VAGELTDVSPELLSQWLADGDTILVDVREDFEHGEEHIEGAVLVPLSKFDADTLRSAHDGMRVVFHCRSGKRSADAASRYCADGERVFQLAGGIDQWKASGKPVVRPMTGPRIPIMRQVQIAAGSLVATGVGLGVLVSSWFLILAGLVGCGLIFAGVSGWCGMAKLLAVMPWNRRSGQACGAASCCSA